MIYWAQDLFDSNFFLFFSLKTSQYHIMELLIQYLDKNFDPIEYGWKGNGLGITEELGFLLLWIA